uniref:Uncharacterized protein n=1 Tax=Alexandrium andersonii TaxID=327968 RepID=A0A7S2DU42_9DINO|mmetsp:Transcript_6003/g.13650  ORF Transcript_6003/g.13650 Transcript_6003/m.13650 type:complete len:225 (+) Transcript_6003:129-803(+)
MQATHFAPGPIQKASGQREPSSLQWHNDFAEEVLVDERSKLISQAVEEGKSMWNGLLAHTKGRRWILGIWSLEVLWILFVVMANSMEMWGACPFEMGLAPVCQYCYSRPFLIWNSILVLLWAFHLYMAVLMASRGFCFRPRASGYIDNEIRGIPKMATSVFLYLFGFIIVWLIAGIVIAVMSNSCLRSNGNFYHHHDRSGLMFGTTVASLALVPVLFFLGRCQL